MTDIINQSKTVVKIKSIMEDEKRLESVVADILQQQENKCEEMKAKLAILSDLLPIIDSEAKKIVINKLIVIYTNVNNAITVMINQQSAFPTFSNKFEDVKESARNVRSQVLQLIGEYSE